VIQKEEKMGINKSEDKNCDYNNFKRARYFHGMLMTDRDFSEEQIYHNEKRKLLNKMLHGWGVVCGLKIKPTLPESSKIAIEPGLALDCAGNEIFVYEPYELDIAEAIKPCTSPKKKPATAEECAEMEKEIQENKWYVVIKYKEVPTDPVPVYAPGGGCEEKVCEYSRIREGYCIELRRTVQCPEKLRESNGPCETLDKPEDIRKFLCEDLLFSCPENCCDNPIVVLGSITFKENITSETTIKKDMINNWDCRKYVITFGLLEHWMTQLAPKKLPFEAIVDYAMLGAACKSPETAVAAFRNICSEEEEEGSVAVPNVVGNDVNNAAEILKKAQLKKGAVKEVVSAVKVGTVIGQDPSAGTEVPVGSAVDLQVAKEAGKTITDIKGIGPVTAEKLAKIGIKSIESLAVAKSEEVAKALDIKEEKARGFIEEAKKMI
jgi:predicted flap endonuclease-1-like 5' DNA nuclease